MKFELLVDAGGNVVGLRKSELSDVQQLITTVGGAYAFGTTQGVSNESRRLQYAFLVADSKALTEEQKLPIKRALLGLRVQDAVYIVPVSAAEANALLHPAQELADVPNPPKPLFTVFVDP